MWLLDLFLNRVLPSERRPGRCPKVPHTPHRLGEHPLDALDECAHERLLGRRDLLRLDLCAREAETVLAGGRITLTGKDAVPAEAIPVAQTTSAPESPVDPPTDHYFGRFPLKFNAGC